MSTEPSADLSAGGSQRAGRSLKARALQWLSQREHSRAELERKLMPHALAEHAAAVLAQPEASPVEPALAVQGVLDWLESKRYLSAERFIESRVHVRSGKYGNLRIQQELSRHRLKLPAEAVQALRDNEFERAAAVRLSKFADWPSTPADRAKQARFLAGRGFSPEVVSRVLRQRPPCQPAAGDPADAE